jgi:PTS system beta-glucosides-specific IIC component
VDVLVRVHSPLAGEVVELSSVSDPVFAGGLLGPGVAIRPSEGLVRSPVDGVVTSLARARHAVGVSSPEGVDVLVHIGIDTVHLAGRGFEALVQQGQQVHAGQPLIRVDLAALVEAGYDPTSPVIVTNAAAQRQIDVLAAGTVDPGVPLIMVTTGRPGG